MSVQVLEATCGKCDAHGLEWARSALGVAYLRNADGSEHWRTCAGVPAPIVDASIETLNAELEESERWRESTARESLQACDWPQVRRAILAYGGIGPSPDWPRDWVPADLYRQSGKAPDLVAAEAMHPAPWGDGGDDARMFDYLHRSWSDWQKAQQQRRPRARVQPTTRPPAEALKAPTTTPTTDMRAIVFDVARLVADVAELAAGDPSPRFARLAREAAQLAQLLTEENAL